METILKYSYFKYKICKYKLPTSRAYWKILEFDLQIVEEAGGTVSRMDGEGFCVFDRSVLVSNNVIHSKVHLHPSIQKYSYLIAYSYLTLIARYFVKLHGAAFGEDRAGNGEFKEEWNRFLAMVQAR